MRHKGKKVITWGGREGLESEKHYSDVIYGQPLMVIVLETFRVDVISRAGLALAIKKGFSTTSSSRRN